MKCSVCGNKTTPEARFCSNCGATLKSALKPTARDVAAPGGGDAANPTPVAPDGAGVRATPILLSPTTLAVGLLLLLAAIGVVGYFGYRALLPDSTSPGATLEPPTTAAEVAAPDVAKPALPQPAGAGAPTTAPPVAAAPTEVPAGTPATKAPAARSAKAGSAKKPAAQRSATKTPPKAPAPAIATPPAPAIAAAPTPPAPPVAVPPPPDRWQPLNDALARCVGLDVIRQAVCEQRARLQYCENYWGQVPLCPIDRTTR